MVRYESRGGGVLGSLPWLVPFVEPAASTERVYPRIVSRGDGLRRSMGFAVAGSTTQNLAAAGQAVASGSAAMSLGVPLAGSGQAASTGGAAMAHGVPLGASGLAAAIASATLYGSTIYIAVPKVFHSPSRAKSMTSGSRSANCASAARLHAYSSAARPHAFNSDARID